jgi:hypothetical protein
MMPHDGGAEKRRRVRARHGDAKMVPQRWHDEGTSTKGRAAPERRDAANARGYHGKGTAKERRSAAADLRDHATSPGALAAFSARAATSGAAPSPRQRARHRGDWPPPRFFSTYLRRRRRAREYERWLIAY